MSFQLRRRAIPVAIASGISIAAVVLYINKAAAQDAAPEPKTQNAAPVEGALPEVKIIQQDKPLVVKQQATPTKKASVSIAEEAPSQPASKPKKKKISAAAAAKSAEPPQQAPAESLDAAEALTTDSNTAPVSGTPAQRSGSLTVPSTAEARAEIERTPGAVDVISDKEFRNSTPATTIKDVLDYVPGVIVQPKWGEDTRLSIRGSGLSRNFHLRGLQLYMDGIPINTADGFGDFQEIDPTAYRYVEVYKGGNALRFGANSLGGAINFVMPTGYDSDAFGARVDVGSFGFHKLSVSSGGVYGAADYFISGTWQEHDGFREHSDGESVRGSMNVGYRLSENVETRFYLNANSVDQRIPGSVTKDVALSSPETAAGINVINDWQRNIDTIRVANKTTVRLSQGTTVEFGAFNVDRHLMHPIFLWLDYDYSDYGGFARLYDESLIAGHKNRFIAGANLHNGEVDAKLFGIGPGAAKGPLFVRTIDESRNVSVYVEDTFYITPQFAVVGGTQFLHAERDSTAIQGAVSGNSEFDLWSPKAGLLYELSTSAQLFANVSRSAEIPSFGENKAIGSNVFDAKAQRATTYEIGTRGRTADFTWDLAFFRANIDNELMCIAPFPVANFCVVANANETIHQGIEAGAGAALLNGIFEKGGSEDQLWLNAAYTYSDFRFDNDPLFGNNELPGAPRHFVRAELLYKHPSGVYFGPNVEWVPEAYFVDSANTLDTKAYALWGLKLGYDNGSTWSAYIEGRNLADEAYIASTGITNVANPTTTNLFEPGTGRAVYGGVQVKW
ncbi:MAG: TonB-dependent receptor [Hyphomicrobium sp.]